MPNIHLENSCDSSIRASNSLLPTLIMSQSVIVWKPQKAGFPIIVEIGDIVMVPGPENPNTYSLFPSKYNAFVTPEAVIHIDLSTFPGSIR